MKYLILILFSVFLVLGCGKDGQDGLAYLSFTWDWYVDSYWDNNSNVPGTIDEYAEYEVDAGRYSYEYYCSDGYGNVWGYEGTYTIEINEGEEGEFLTDGEDGEDNHYRFNLTGNGSSLSLRKPAKQIRLDKSIPEILNNKDRHYVGSEKRIIINKSSGRMVITKQKFILK